MPRLANRLASTVAPQLGAVLVAASAAIGCGASDASDPACFDATPAAPPPSDYLTAGLMNPPPRRDLHAGSVTIDLESCDPAEWSVWLPLGSAWVLVHPKGDACELWLGGETENPRYDGGPTQYCRLRRDDCKATLSIGNGGPARLVSGGCVDL